MPKRGAFVRFRGSPAARLGVLVAVVVFAGPRFGGLDGVTWGQAGAARQPGDPAVLPHGFHRLEGRHLTLITDLPPAAAVRELPQVFDQAIGQWCTYFGIPSKQVAAWRLRGYLMVQRERFRALGWLPDNLPPFPHGFQRGDTLWVMEQPSDYYRRHLLLHEGTHAFMARWLGGTGPPWYMEGMAELLATHHYEAGSLTLKVLPQRKQDVPEWGRIKLIRDAVEAGSSRSLSEVFELPPRQFSDVDAYAWSWAAATFLDGHPRWQERFRALKQRVAWDRARFLGQFWHELQPDRAALEEAWQLFVDQLDYGYDVAQDAIWEQPLRRWTDEATARVDSSRGWQSTGLGLKGGRRYQVVAQGRYQLNRQDPPWFSEAGGVTLRYHRGRPSGMLLAAIRPVPPAGQESALLRPYPIGLQTVLEPPQDGILYLRVNELAGELGDNLGELRVEVRKLGPKDRAEQD